MEEKQYYFDTPKQVKFFQGYENDDKNCAPLFGYGIGYLTDIICACCGGVIEPNEVIEEAKFFGFEGEPIHIYNDWVDFSDSVCE